MTGLILERSPSLPEHFKGRLGPHLGAGRSGRQPHITVAESGSEAAASGEPWALLLLPRRLRRNIRYTRSCADVPSSSLKKSNAHTSLLSHGQCPELPGLTR